LHPTLRSRPCSADILRTVSVSASQCIAMHWLSVQFLLERILRSRHGSKSVIVGSNLLVSVLYSMHSGLATGLCRTSRTNSL
jgi:hypothetical protein